MRAIALVVILTCLSTVALGQAAASLPNFDVVSVKPTPPERQNRLRTDRCTAGGAFLVAAAPVMWSLTYAFSIKDYQVVSAPPWLNEFSSAFDIQAKPSDPVNEEQCRLMLQSLFRDYFKLSAHWETKEASVYLLTVAKNGSKLQQGGGVRLNGSVQLDGSGKKPQWPDGLTMPELAAILSGYTDRPVIDRTGFAGTYGIRLDFALSDKDDRASIFTAVQEQLGLKLEAGKAPVEMLVIDHIEKPAPH